MSASSSNSSSFKNSFDATAKDRAELFRDDFLPINLDVQVTLTTVLGALPRLRMLREEIVAQLPKFELGRFDSLEAYAEALSFANTAYLAASQPSEALPALTARAMEMRDMLLSDAQVADVVNYVRTHFGNTYQDALTADDVKAFRPATHPEEH